MMLIPRRLFLVLLTTSLALASIIIFPRTVSAAAEESSAGKGYGAWKHTGSMFVLTTPDGANIPETAYEKEFPLLVRLTKEFFNFDDANARGDDIRFSTPAGEALSYEIDEWDAGAHSASIWVRLPAIRGNQRQEIVLHWGNPDAKSESSSKSVFNQASGYLSVLHLGKTVADEVGTVLATDSGTTPAAGMIGHGRHLGGKQGIFCGDKIVGFPTGSEPYSSEAWFRADHSNGTIIAWGNEQARGKRRCSCAVRLMWRWIAISREEMSPARHLFPCRNGCTLFIPIRKVIRDSILMACWTEYRRILIRR